MRLPHFILALLLLCAARTSAQNRVLQLGGGTNACVELPSRAFNDLEEATIEGWVKWNGEKWFARFFDFGRAWRTIHVARRGGSASVGLDLVLSRNTGIEIVGANLFHTNQWCHVAAVIAKDRASLYFNGLLVGTASYSGSFNTIQSGERNALGRDNWREAFGDIGDDTACEIDEFRVWKVARTGQQIADNMFKQLTSKEENLAGLWNFDDGTANDSSPRAQHGKLIGDAKTVPAPMPAREELLPMFTLRGMVKDADGRPIQNATITVLQNEKVFASVPSDSNRSPNIFVSVP